jgi:hypothetical protein
VQLAARRGDARREGRHGLGRLAEHRPVWIVAGGKVWVARAPSEPTGQVIVDPVALTLSTLDVAMGAYGLAEANGRVYVACASANRIDVIDVATGAIFLESEGMISVLVR